MAQMMQMAKLVADDAASGDNFGHSVSISGDYKIVGSSFDDSQSGSAYIFIRSGTSWSQQAKLVASDAAGGDRFGYFVSISGDYAVVGAIGGESAYIFGRSFSTWPQQAKIVASDAASNDQFGRSVSISGDYALVGAPTNGSDTGSAYIFTRSGTSWSQQAKLVAGDAAAGDRFGISVSISGDYALVASYKDEDAGRGSGSAYIFIRDGTSWSQQAQLVSSDLPKDDNFGNSVSLSGDYALVGAYQDDDGAYASGSAYIFIRDGTSWSQQAKLVSDDPASADYFGFSVSISGDYAVVGMYSDDDGGSASGSAYTFVRDGTSWSQQAKLVSSDLAANDYFGYSVSISGDYAVVGAYYDDDVPNNSGSAYTFVRSGTSWSQQAKLVASDAATNDNFGYSVSISGDYALVGAYQDDDGGSNSGAAYTFIRDGTSWSQQAKLVASDAADADHFGWSVSISGDYALVGAKYDDDASSNSGSAYTFVRSGTSW
ncbi:MAG: FG-GAP repeat protein, partial [Candidatus Neomarinimicrobiota bacterium]|nr:FG-GAP repeat protein [Candidatus Neomarinimicrobiota bacterium]